MRMSSDEDRRPGWFRNSCKGDLEEQIDRGGHLSPGGFITFIESVDVDVFAMKRKRRHPVFPLEAKRKDSALKHRGMADQKFRHGYAPFNDFR
ncbi:hypothetical protein SAMN05444404_3495 [Ruegeria lacuscaerulensis ITI-1157]|nr:hypothetical protein SAMN05444404_3495 [Ruegeria lacuscaerulensis ITI-1157]